MAVRDDDHVHVARLVAGWAEPLDQPAIGHAGAQLLALAPQRAVAGIEQHKFLPGIHEGRDERMFITQRIDAVGARERLHLFGRPFAAEPPRFVSALEDLSANPPDVQPGGTEIKEAIDATDRGAKRLEHNEWPFVT